MPRKKRQVLNKKRSIWLKGQPTSVSVEDPFWQQLKVIAAERDMTHTQLIEVINDARPEGSWNLCSAIRLAVLQYYIDKVECLSTPLPQAEHTLLSECV